MNGVDYWNRHARNYDRSMKLLGGPIPGMVARVAESVRGRERVLEVAAGTGLVTLTLAREARSVVATDYAAQMVATLRARVEAAGLTNVLCEPADIYQLGYAPGCFQAVVAANVLHLVPDLPAALAALRRVLAPGGTLIVPTFCHDQTWRSWMVSRLLALTGFPGKRRFKLATLRQTLEAAGLSPSRCEVIPGLIPIGYVEGTFGPV